jgi:hypothetical protein
MLNGGLVQRVFAGHIWLVYAIAWFPITVLMFIRAYESHKYGAQIGAGLCVAILILTGHPAFPLYTMIFLGFYWLYRIYLSWCKEPALRTVILPIGKLILILCFGICLCAIQLIPTYILLQETSLSAGYSLDKSNFKSLAISDLPAFLIPQFYISVGTQNYFWEFVPYLGILFILIIPITYLSNQNKTFVLFLGIMALFSLVLAFGESGGLYNLLYSVFPPLRIVRVPPRSLFIWMPAITMVGGFGLQTLFDNKLSKQRQSNYRSFLYLSVVFIIYLALGYKYLPGMDNIWKRIAAPMRFLIQGSCVFLLFALISLLTRIYILKKSKLVMRVAALIALAVTAWLIRLLLIPSYLIPSAYMSQNDIFTSLLKLVLPICTLIVLLSQITKTATRKILIGLLILIQYIDVGGSGVKHIDAVSPPVFYEEERLLLKNVGINPFDRILIVENDNLSILEGISNIDGYNSGILDGYKSYLQGVSQETDPSSESLLLPQSRINNRALDFLGVRYLLSAYPIEDQQLELINRQDNHYLYHNLNALPRLYMVYDYFEAHSDSEALNVLLDATFDYTSSVVLQNTGNIDIKQVGVSDITLMNYESSNGDFDLLVTTSESGLLVMSEPHFSERKAWIDDEEVPVLKANIGFIAINVPSGAHRVEIRYVPTSFYAGAMITCLTLIVMIVVVVVEKKNTSRRQYEI